MPRKARNLYLRGETWWGRVKVAGREYRGSLRTTDPREAAKRLKGWRTKLEREAVGSPDSPTWQAAVVKWAAEVLPRSVKPSVAKRYLVSIGQLERVFGALRVDQITPARIAAAIATRAASQPASNPRRMSSTRYSAKFVRPFSRWNLAHASAGLSGTARSASPNPAAFTPRQFAVQAAEHGFEFGSGVLVSHR